jgi:hypothetical protein
MSTIDDPFDRLKVISSLEVGPVKLELKRLVAPYKVIQNEQEYSTDLIYSYEEDVFDTADPESQNMANMIAAQVAINYGLFCDRISFHGIYDETDQRFLCEMADNTAQEIYVKKFLEPNPFLIREWKKFPVIKRESYLQARMVFLDGESNNVRPACKPWQTDPDRYAILSSGGKDSLLSFGLLNELGLKVYPIFGNESGRHWFSALNAHRYFKEHIPNTGRVWMNSDRLFSWMLRRLPFIRQDFATIRSDDYPIRLWTVAVFLFGVLPLLRKKRIGRILIGDEYDTTWLASYEGISHYNGLYDQSSYFDNTLTDYFEQKRWSLSQFSILRHLSEILILKILVERYPALQAQQVSCHATHKEGDRVYPCGKCEKCRRIVGILMALNADPAQCGYSRIQTEHCLKELAIKGAHQESAGVNQLFFMLLEKGLIELPEERKRYVQPCPEIMKLRFHPECAPVDTIPENLQEPLYRIYLEHSDGALTRIGKKWGEFSPLTSNSKH